MVASKAGKKDVTGHEMGLALTSVNKFLAYNMIDESKPNVTSAVENLADAVTHARFVGSDPSSDEVVLMKILDVLRILILSKVGLLLTNESICEIMQFTLRICFKPRLSELLLKTSQHCLTDMVQLLFTRLPTFTEHQRPLLKKLKMRSFGDSKSKKKTKVRPKKASSPSPRRTQSSPSVSSLASKPVAVQSGAVLARSPSGSVADLSIVSDSELENVSVDLAPSDVEQSDLPMEEKNDLVSKEVTEEKSELEDEGKLTVNIQVTSPEGSVKDSGGNAAAAVEEMNIPPAEDAGVQEPSLDFEFTNPTGVTFSVTADSQDSSGAMIPTGLPAVYELFRFLASLINPYEQQNSEHQIGLGLVNSALEVGMDAIGQFASLMGLVKDELARLLIALLSSERNGMFSSALRCCFFVFNSLRGSLKFQLENFLVKLIDLISSESARVSYEYKELALELLVMLYKVPGFITELYLNYDCDLYTSNLFEDITKVLSKNALPLDELLSTNHLALEGLLVILNTVEKQCQRRISDRVPQPPIFVNDGTIRSYSCKTLDTISENTSVMAKASGYMFASNLGEETTTSGPISEKSEVVVPTHENLMAIKHKKKLITTGTEQFNINPKKSIAYLQENRLLVTPIDPREVAHFLRENPHLDKNMIGEYISNKKNIDIFKVFVKSFDFTNSRIDEVLRQFLECFRLPGEAPVISKIVENFAEHWHKSNRECVADADSPYTLSYAVIMLNTDQHNANASKTNIPMTCEQFIKNLRGTNGGGDHDPEMLTEIYQAIKGDEIVMPAEQKGLVKENYLWKMLLKRGSEHSGDFLRTDNGMFDHNLFGLTWGPSIASLSYVFDRSNNPEVLKRSIGGFSKTAMIATHSAMSDVLDNLIISLTKFTTLLSTTESPDIFKIMYGANAKALLATRAIFSLTHKFGDILREGWKNLLECLLQLFKCQLLPKSLMEAEDYIESSGRINLFREKLHREKEDRGLINSLVSFIVASSEAPHSLTAEEEEHVDMAKKTILECHPEHLLSESKFLLTDSLQELVKYLVGGSVLDGGDERADEHVALFYLELVTRITVANRDRVGIIWRSVSDHLISASAGNVETNFQLERAVTALLRLSVRLARKEDLASTTVQSLRILLAMKTGSNYVNGLGIKCLLFNQIIDVISMLLILAGIEQNPGPDSEDDFEEASGNDVKVLIRPTMTKNFLMMVNKSWTLGTLKLKIHKRLVELEEFYSDKNPEQLKLLVKREELNDLNKLTNKADISVIYLLKKFVAPLRVDQVGAKLSKRNLTTNQEGEPVSKKARIDVSDDLDLPPSSKKKKLSRKKLPITTSKKARLDEDRSDVPDDLDLPSPSDKNKISKRKLPSNQETNETISKKGRLDEDRYDVADDLDLTAPSKNLTGNVEQPNGDIRRQTFEKICSYTGCLRETWHLCRRCTMPVCNIHSVPQDDNEMIRIHTTDCRENVAMSDKIKLAMSASNIKAPMKNKTAFAFFCEDKLKGNPITSINPQRKILMKKTWGVMNNEERNPYQSLAEKDLKRYREEMQTYAKEKYKVKKKSSNNAIANITIPEKQQTYEKLKKNSQVSDRISKIKERPSITEDRCGFCKPCRMSTDCDKCKMCLDKVRNGGKRKIRKGCLERVCLEKKPSKEKIPCDCQPCKRNDCGDCPPCRSKPKFGGSKSLKKRCLVRICEKPKRKKCNTCLKIHKHDNFCCKCKKIFSTPDKLSTHLCSKGPKCTKCEKVFTYLSKLKKHERTAHKEIDEEEQRKRKKCLLCDKTFCNNQVLRQHHETIHLGNKKALYKCEICGKPQYSKTYLEAHIQVHKQGYAFKCPYCNKAFMWRSTFMKHNCVDKIAAEENDNSKVSGVDFNDEEEELEEERKKSTNGGNKKRKLKLGKVSSDTTSGSQQPLDPEIKTKSDHIKDRLKALLRSINATLSNLKRKINSSIENGIRPDESDLGLLESLKVQRDEVENQLTEI